MDPRGRWRSKTLVLVGLTLFAIGCSSPTSEDVGSDRLDTFKDETSEALDDLAAELADLDLDERRERLIDLAMEEGGSVSVYGVTALEEAGPLIEEFESDTGITVNYFKASSTDILQRLVEEARADFRGADAVVNNGPEMEIQDREGLLAELNTPILEQITPEGRRGTWSWSFIDIFAAAWNTKMVSAGEAPKTWEEVLTGFEGDLAMEVGDVDWFATLVKHLIAEEGMTEEEALDLFREAARGATFIDGHSLMTELVASGEFAVTASPYLHRVRQYMGDGADLEWEPAVEPLITRPEGVGVHATAENPAAALLWVEYYLTDAQEFLLAYDLQPANTTVKGGGLPPDYESIGVDVTAVIDEFDKWADLYDEIVQLSGEEVIAD